MHDVFGTDSNMFETLAEICINVSSLKVCLIITVEKRAVPQICSKCTHMYPCVCASIKGDGTTRDVFRPRTNSPSHQELAYVIGSNYDMNLKGNKM